jgi:transcriptional regulator with XRE-family HTH domain
MPSETGEDTPAAKPGKGPALLREWRTRQGLTLGALALKAGVSKAALSRWEAGRAKPRLAELQATLDALRVTPEQRAELYDALDAPGAFRLLLPPAGEEGSEEDGPPLTGELLRVLRLRRALTQSEVAARIGVRQGTVAKWENSEDWPAPDRLEALCEAVRATPEEAEALMSGRFAPADLPNTPEGIAERLEQVRQGRSDPARRRLDDLTLFSLEAAVWSHAMHSRAGRELRLRVLWVRLMSLIYQRRYAEAEPVAGQVLRQGVALASEAGTPDALPAEAQDAAVAVGMLRASEPAEPGPERLRAALDWLRAYEGVVDRPDSRAWLLRQTAQVHALRGERDAALSCHEQAEAVPPSGGIGDRRRAPETLCSGALLMTRVGRHEDALARTALVLSGGVSPAVDPQQAIRARIVEVRAYGALGDAASARASSAEAAALIEAADLPHFLAPLADALAATLAR